MSKPLAAFTALLPGFFVSACVAATTDAVAQNSVAEAPATTSSSEIFTRSGVYVENALNSTTKAFLQRPSVIIERFSGMALPVMMDFNGDGVTDMLFIGGQAYDGDFDPDAPDSATSRCGTKGYCNTNYAKPSLFLGRASGTYVLRDDLVIDNRERPGLSSGSKTLVADYNRDGILDFYIADTGLGDYRGGRDSYFLSQPNGTWVESSATHLKDPNFVIFDHGGATGDIDGDGDFDVVLTDLNAKIWCMINDGTGSLSKRQCGNIFAFGIELADIDGDGDLDLIHAANEFEITKNNANLSTGVAYNDGRGNFRYRSIAIQMRPEWGSISEVSSWDLDSDGDMDIAISRTREHYVGSAIEILENLGSGKFDSKLYILFDAPAGFDPGGREMNTWAQHIESIRFTDLDHDGDMDIPLPVIPDGPRRIPEGAILRNDGNMNFSVQYGVMPSIGDHRLIVGVKN